MKQQTPGILRQKITPPPPPPHGISRKALLKDVNNHFHWDKSFPQIILMTAPAGYGKTTFAEEWTASLDHPVLWYSIDENDNDLHRYLSYLIHTLKQHLPNLGKGSLDMLSHYSALSEGGFNIETLLTPIMNELYDLNEPLYLVLDHYHHIDDPKIHQAMVFFLSNLPNTITPIILSRWEPPWPLHQWRSKGQLLEITEKDLRLSTGEMALFLKKSTGINPSEEDLKVLQEKIEGWVTPLQLLTGSLRKAPDIQKLLDTLVGDHQKILSYLTEEILHQQPVDIQEFLLKTSQLSRFTPALCNTLLDRKDSQQIIHYLLEKNLFISSLDHQGKWFRYHPLFQEILSYHYNQEEKSSGKISDRALHNNAGKWLEAEKYYGEAIRSYCRAKNYQAMAKLLIEHIDNLWDTEGFIQVLTWMEALPADVRSKSFRLLVYAGFMYLLKGNLEETQHYFSLADEIQDFEDPEAKGILETLRTTFHIFNGDLAKGLISAEKALEQLPSDAYFWRISSAVVYGDVKVFSGDLHGAHEIYREAYRWSRRSGNALSTVSAAMNILKVLWMRGDLLEARRFGEETLKNARAGGYAHLPRLGVVWIFLSEFLREDGNLVESERFGNRGLALSEPETILYGMGCILRGALSYSKKNYDEGLQSLGKIEEIQRETDLPELMIDLIKSWKSLLLMTKGDVYSARELMNTVDLNNPATIYFPGNPSLVNARLLLLEYNLPQAETALEVLKNLPQYHSSRRLMIDILLIEAELKELQDDKTGAEDILFKALKAGRNHGFYQIFRDQEKSLYPIMERILIFNQKVASKNLHQDPGLLSFIKKLGQDFKAIPPKKEERFQELVEALTDRELEILKAISQGLSNDEISNTMYLSVHTVKWHNKNIFGKLGVSNRTQAVVRGRELQLIS